MGRKKYYLIIDVEGTGDANKGNQLPYDVGGVIMDRQGAILETFSFINKDVFCDGRLMSTAYYAEKTPEYIDRLFRQETTPATTGEIFSHISRLAHQYKVSDIWAYNIRYDRQALRNAANAFHQSFTSDEYQAAKHVVNLIPNDIWRAAAEVLYNFHYCKFCKAHGFLTEKGNIRTGAEFGYKFISGNPDFEEEHRGLDDCYIEAAILAKVLKAKKKFNATPVQFLHRVVMKKATHGNSGKRRRPC